jgi:hypothetical protein
MQDSLDERDYYLLAEKNVKQRRWQQKPLLHKLENEMMRDKASFREEEDEEEEEEEEEEQEEEEEPDEEILQKQPNKSSGFFPFRNSALYPTENDTHGKHTKNKDLKNNYGVLRE